MRLFLRLFFGCVLQIAPFGFLCLYPFEKHLRYSVRQTALLGMTVIGLLGVVFATICCGLAGCYPPGQTLFNLANGVFLLALVPCLLLYLHIVREDWRKKLFLFLFALTGALAMTSAANVVDTTLQRGQTLDGLPYYGLSLLTLTLLTAICLPLLCRLLQTCYLPVADVLSSKEGSLLCALAFLLFAVLLAGLMPLGYDHLYTPRSFYLYLTLLVCVFVLYMVCFRMLFYAHEKQAAKQALALMEHQLTIHHEQYKRIHENIENSRRMRHDFRHHALALQGFLTAGELEKAEEYLGQFTASLDEAQLGIFCENRVVDTVVGYYSTLAHEKNIRLSLRISVPETLAVQDSDLSVLLGNLMENAITAADCAPPARRAIQLNMICSGKMLAITVDNGFDGRVRQVDGGYGSTKQDHIGIGLRSIESLAEKYGGGVEFTHEDSAFHASVMLCIG